MQTTFLHSQMCVVVVVVVVVVIAATMEVIAQTAQSAVEEILNESTMALVAMMRSSKLLPLLMRRLNFSQDALHLTRSSVNVTDVKWPLICDFSVDGIIERIREYITFKWHLFDCNDVLVTCTTTCTLDNIEMYHFKAILLKSLEDEVRLQMPMAGMAPIYFLVEFPTGPQYATQAVTVTYQFAGTKSIHLLSSGGSVHELTTLQ